MDLQSPKSSATASHHPFSKNTITELLAGEYDDSWLTIFWCLVAPPKTTP